MNRIGKQLSHATACACIVVLSLTPAVQAEPVDLSDIPLYVFEGVDPNIILSMDDSGSMYWSYMPDSIKYTGKKKRATSVAWNKIYYDPTLQYLPPTDENGASLGDADFTDAWNDGYAQSNTCKINLATSYRPTWYYGNHCDGSNYNGSSSRPEYGASAQPAFYHVFDTTNSGCDGNTANDNCYDKVVVSTTSGPGSTDERQNFANWYSYYRKRIYITKAAAARAFSNLSGGFRLAHQTINGSGSLTDPALYTGSNRDDFYNWLFALDATGSTPLRAAAERAGEYLETATPYRDDPQDNQSPQRSCRQNFHVMLTDGYWNSSSGVSGNKDNSSRSVPDNEFGITSYSPRPPFKDSNSAYLADNTFYYWVRDLRSTLEDNVPTNIVDTHTDIDGDGDVDDIDIFWNPANDPANWQHMVSFTIGLGIFGDLDYPGDYDDLLSGDLDWPTSSAPGETEKVDDLWHAAVNGRGLYFSAANASEMMEAFQNVVGDIVDRTGSSSAVALNSGAISSDAQLFQARFDTSGWAGHLLAKRISDGSNCGAVPVGSICMNLWDAACKLNGGLCEATGATEAAQATREIITMNSDTLSGVAFAWDQLSPTQQTAMRDPDGLGPLVPDAVQYTEQFGKDVIAFLRGDRTKEAAAGGIFRTRVSILGDIIYSSPVYVGPPNRLYEQNSSFPEGEFYAAFATSHSGRMPIVFVGSNDGMVHGFDAEYGYERIAYIPNELFGKLWRLHQTDYVHDSFVDGPLSAGDVYYANDWHTSVVGGLGLGGQGYYALDTTKVSSLYESNAANIAMWEFTDDDDADLGYSYGKPAIVRLANGKWAAIFGNGLNSTDTAAPPVSSDGDAAVFIVDIQDGSVIKKLKTKTGKAEDPHGLSRANGIVGIAPVDADGDFVLDGLYATDLFGNVWAFDLSGSGKGSWKSKYGTNANPEPLFRATDANGDAQPITTPPAVGRHPSGLGVMVYFGTGKYLGSTDILDYSTQTFYGIWDHGVNGFGRSRLLEQTVTQVNLNQFAGVDARVVSDNPIRWDDGVGSPDADEKRGWYLDLPESGERVHQKPFLRNDRVIFVTVTPSDDPCKSGGTSWLMEMNATDGSRLDFTPFDYNGDGTFTKDDLVKVDYDVNGDGQVDADDVLPGSGIRVDDSGVITTPAVALHPDLRKESKFSSSSTAKVIDVTEDTDLNQDRSWVELR